MKKKITKKKKATNAVSVLKTSAKVNQSYGWTPDLPDRRDLLYSAKKPTYVSLPPSVDLRSYCSPIEDQRSLGSCTANALVGNLEFLHIKHLMMSGVVTDLSRLFLYYNERLLMGTINSDSGARLRDGIKSLVKQGVCSEETWPYKISDFTKKPSALSYTEALSNRITEYSRLSSLNDMKTCLAEGYPFVFGFTVYDGFESQTVMRTGTLNLPTRKERVRGGHAVMCVGYDDTKLRFIIRNSWGVDFGMDGYFTMPYEYLEDRNLSDDLWSVRL